MSTTSLRDLLLKQRFESKFSRMDLIVRYAFLESLYGVGSYELCKDLYLKMQLRRAKTLYHRNGKRYDKEFINLANKIKEEGYDEEFPLIVNKEGHLINSSHRAACCLYFRIQNPPIKIVNDWQKHLETKFPKKKSYFYYSRDWFVDNEFSEAELNFIDLKKSQMMINNNLFFPVIVWSPAYHFYLDIEEGINKEHDIYGSYDYEFATPSEYETFIRKVYEVDDIARNKVDKKVAHILSCKNPLKVRVVYVDLFGSNFRKKTTNKNKIISTQVESLKKKIRNKFSPQIDDYIYDIIIHAGDNYRHTDHMIDLLGR